MWDERNTADLVTQLVSWRRMFHRNPELSTKERETSITILDALRKMEIEVVTFTNHFGLCGIIQGKYPGPVVALRTDMDALPITEANDVSYHSQTSGVMHACGHDGHMAIMLGVAKMFSLYHGEFAGTIKLIFQPAEEAAPVGGAGLIIEEGILEDVDVIFGLHLWPDLPCGHIGIRQGPLMAASDRITIKILGQAAHAGQPQHGVDGITIAADVIQGLGQLMNRQIDPLETATLSIGNIQGGERYNVIASEVLLDGTVRTLGEIVRRQMPLKIERALAGITAAQGGHYELDYQFGYPVLNNWAEPTGLIIKAARDVVGSEAVHGNVKPVLAAEDFGRYLEKIPGAFFWLGCAKEGQENYHLHSSHFDIDEDALLIGAKIMHQLVLKALVHYDKEGKR
ncbi:MAG: amidohydrolase [Pelosinus sp.]|jgi:amidohydrolase|nr:amidohydrolase [Pelosinus sp.]